MSVDTQVLIVGAGPTGLVLSALLSRFGVDNLVVDRDPSTTDHPQAHVVNTRSMEILSFLGIADEVRAHALAGPAGGSVRWVRSLVGPELARLSLAPPPDTIPELVAASPVSGGSCPQDRIEPLLAELANQGQGRVQFDTTLLDLAQDDHGVTATVQHDGHTEQISADWLVGCDGAGSTTRRLSDIAMVGPDALARLVGIYFHADLGDIARQRPAILYWTVDEQMPGTFITLDGRERWVFHAPTDTETFDPADYSPEQCREILQRAIGTDVDVDIRSVRPWVMTGQVAERYRRGRVLLAGDAAHRFPPTGGYGMNTGIQDAHNLAWKLAMVTSGEAGQGLIDTYEHERLPVAQGNAEWSVANAAGLDEVMGSGAQAQARRLAAGQVSFDELATSIQAIADRERNHFGSFGRDLGFRYHRGAIVSDGTTPPAADDPDREYIPNATPGARAPHFPIIRDGETMSSLDLFDGRWTLLSAGDTADRWRESAANQRIPIHAIGVGIDVADPSDSFTGLFQVDIGAVLVRPDGHVAWRCATLPSDPTAELGAALDVLLDRPPQPTGRQQP